MKKINLQCVYEIPDGFPWVAINLNGAVNLFKHPPIRDFQTGEWQDSVDGSYGEFVAYESWDRSVHEVALMSDRGKINIPRQRGLKNKTYNKGEEKNAE
jgi:hypothetical protein